MNIKDFKDVQIGDIAIDYCDERNVVIDKGTLKDMCEKYKNKQSVSLEEALEMGIDEDDDVVVVKETSETLEGYTCILFSYGPDGAYVEL